MPGQTIYISCLLISFISADSIIVDTTAVYTANVNNQTNCKYIHKQNKKCLRNLDVKWQIIEKLVHQKINNKK